LHRVCSQLGPCIRSCTRTYTNSAHADARGNTYVDKCTATALVSNYGFIYVRLPLCCRRRRRPRQVPQSKNLYFTPILRAWRLNYRFLMCLDVHMPVFMSCYGTVDPRRKHTDENAQVVTHALVHAHAPLRTHAGSLQVYTSPRTAGKHGCGSRAARRHRCKRSRVPWVKWRSSMDAC